MAHITLSIPDVLYEKMKRHRQIKWSEAARRGIQQELMQLENVVDGRTLFLSLPEKTKESIEKTKKLRDWRQWQKKMRQKEQF